MLMFQPPRKIVEQPPRTASVTRGVSLIHRAANIALLVLTTPANSRPIHVRLRTVAARRYKMVANAEALIWKILTIAEEKFPRFNSPELL